MGLAPGGRMEQEIYDDPHDFDVWDTRAREYSNAGLPWFDYYGGDAEALSGAKKLAGLKTVAEMGEAKGEHPLPENTSVDDMDMVVVPLGSRPMGDRVREGRS